MSDPHLKFEALQRIFPNGQLLFERKEPFALLSALKIPSGNKEHVTDALLCPHRHSSASYPTRLFLEKQPPRGGQHWNVFQVLGRSWRGCSWDKVPASLSWPEILFAHLRVFK